MYIGYLVLAYTWLRMAVVANEKLAAGTSEELFYKTKIQTADFYFKRVLPRAQGHLGAARGGASCLMDMPEEAFAF